jgi:hypothetical protein
MPRFRPVLSGQPQPHQYAEGSRGLEEIEFREYRDSRLAAFTMSERDQACRLRFGEDKISSFERHADLPLIREVAVCAIVLRPVVHGKAVVHSVKQKVRSSRLRILRQPPWIQPLLPFAAVQHHGRAATHARNQAFRVHQSAHRRWSPHHRAFHRGERRIGNGPMTNGFARALIDPCADGASDILPMLSFGRDEGCEILGRGGSRDRTKPHNCRAAIGRA